MSLREGSTHEEEALVQALREVVSTVDTAQDDARTLLPVLVQFGHTQKAGELQARLMELVGVVRAGMDGIWSGGGREESGPASVQVCEFKGRGGVVMVLLCYVEAVRSRCYSQQYYSGHDRQQARTCGRESRYV